MDEVEVSELKDELEQSIKELEENILWAIGEAEQGNAEVVKTLDELKEDIIVACKDEVILRLAEYYCLSLETSEKAYWLCKWLKENDRVFGGKNFTNCFLLSGALPAAENIVKGMNQAFRMRAP